MFVYLEAVYLLCCRYTKIANNIMTGSTPTSSPTLSPTPTLTGLIQYNHLPLLQPQSQFNHLHALGTP